MITLNALPKLVAKGKKRVGRGIGSGKGSHTVGKGQKGQKTRDNVKLLFQGTKSNKDFFRRTPMLRGKSKLKSYKAEPVELKLSALDIFKDGDTVDLASLVKAKLVSEKEAGERGVKILFDKKLEKKLVLSVPASKTVVKSLTE